MYVGVYIFLIYMYTRCVYTCIYVYIYLYVYRYMYLSMEMYIYIYEYISMFRYLYINICICIHKCMYIFIFIFTYLPYLARFFIYIFISDTSICICIHLGMHEYICRYVYIYFGNKRYKHNYLHMIALSNYANVVHAKSYYLSFLFPFFHAYLRLGLYILLICI
jgi:hypothetical protein